MAEANFEKINSSQRLRSQSNWAVNYYVDCRKESARDKNHNFTTPNVKKGDVQALKDLGAASPHLEMFLWRHWGLNLQKKHPTKRTSLNAFCAFLRSLKDRKRVGLDDVKNDKLVESAFWTWKQPCHAVDVPKSDGFQLDELLFVWALIAHYTFN